MLTSQPITRGWPPKSTGNCPSRLDYGNVEGLDGPSILVSSMSVPRVKASDGRMWQYHSRSDLHSKVACWGVLFDLLQQSALLRSHAASGQVIFGVNFEMRDFATGRKKKLDLVVARPAAPVSPKPATLDQLADSWQVELDATQRGKLANLPALPNGTVGAVLIALEAKAAMTAHTKARPRLYDELNSSHLTVHGASRQALAVGFVMVNLSKTFLSPGLQLPGQSPIVSTHSQPRDALGIIEKVREIPRRVGPVSSGYDGLAIVTIECANDGSPVTLVTAPPSPPSGDIYQYETMVTRVANEYDTTFSGI